MVSESSCTRLTRSVEMYILHSPTQAASQGKDRLLDATEQIRFQTINSTCMHYPPCVCRTPVCRVTVVVCVWLQSCSDDFYRQRAWRQTPVTGPGPRPTDCVRTLRHPDTPVTSPTNFGSFSESFKLGDSLSVELHHPDHVGRCPEIVWLICT